MLATSGLDHRTMEVCFHELRLPAVTIAECAVLSVAITPDGRRIVSGSDDETVRVWDTSSGAQLAVLRGHEGRVECVAVTPDGGRIVSGSRDKTVRVWDANSGTEVAALCGHEHNVSSVAVTAD
jgi:WD40 repeat protein